MPKRKQPAAAHSRSPKRRCETHTITSRLLALAPELRNAIYELLLPDVTTVYILPQGAGYVTSPHPLHLVCKQLHREFSGLLSRVAPETANAVVAEVVDFDFGGAMTFLKRVKKSPSPRAGGLGEFGGGGKKRLIVELTVRREWCERPDVEGLLKWQKWMARAKVANAALAPMVRFEDVQDKEAARERLNKLALGFGAEDKFWVEVMGAFREWYVKGTNVAAFGDGYDENGDEIESEEDGEEEEEEEQRFRYDEDRVDWDGYVI